MTGLEVESEPRYKYPGPPSKDSRQSAKALVETTFITLYVLYYHHSQGFLYTMSCRIIAGF